MRKLLSLLSVLTISVTAVPTTIAASPYQKEKQIKLENIKYKRQKRSNNKNNKIGKTKIVIKTNNVFTSRGIILNNKLYFGLHDIIIMCMNMTPTIIII